MLSQTMEFLIVVAVDAVVTVVDVVFHELLSHKKEGVVMVTVNSLE
jgi:hypothetical protein